MKHRHAIDTLKREIKSAERHARKLEHYAALCGSKEAKEGNLKWAEMRQNYANELKETVKVLEQL